MVGMYEVVTLASLQGLNQMAYRFVSNACLAACCLLHGAYCRTSLGAAVGGYVSISALLGCGSTLASTRYSHRQCILSRCIP